MTFNIYVLRDYGPLLLQGAGNTVLICCLSLVIGAIVGAILCAFRLSGKGISYELATLFIDINRALPELIVIVWVYSCAPLIFNIALGSLTTGIAALSALSAAYLAEIFRAGVVAVSRGQFEAADSLALPPMCTWRIVIIPQALRTVIPPFLNFLCDLIKASTLLSVLGIAELSYRATIASAETYRYFEIYTAVGAIYFAIIFPLSAIARHFERRARA